MVIKRAFLVLGAISVVLIVVVVIAGSVAVRLSNVDPSNPVAAAKNPGWGVGGSH